MSAYDAWWDGTREQRFLLQRCDACGRSQHPPRPVCRHCHTAALSWVEASGAAEVDAWTTVHRSPGPGFDPPYVVARVRLVEGPIVLTHLIGGDRWCCGDPVRLSWRALPDGRHLPVFDPMED